MRGLPVLAVFSCCLALPAAAQRGGAAHGFGGGHASGGFHGGGFQGRSPGFAPRSGVPGSGFRGGASSAAVRPGFSAARQFANARAERSPFGVAGARAFAPRVSAVRPTFYSRSGSGYRGPGRPGGYRPPYRGRGGRFGYPYVGYGYSGLIFPGILDLDFLDWNSLDPFGYDTPAYAAESPESYPSGAAYANQTEDYPSAAPIAEAQPPSAPGPWAPGVSPAPRPPEEDAVTVIFKDGRPPVQIHNYALTRTSLYLPGQHAREIPLDEIDLPATEQVNRAAGVNFQLP